MAALQPNSPTSAPTPAVHAAPLRRVAPAERIAALDVLRGIAILAIFILNIPWMGGYATLDWTDPRLVSWTLADRIVWTGQMVLLDGTQRGLLELLFGAGVMIMCRTAMQSDGPVAVADLHYRRNLWLMAFGAAHIFLFLWPGDILLIYGLAAIFLFPFRTLLPRAKVFIGGSLILAMAASGVVQYAARADLMNAAASAQAKQSADLPLTPADKQALESWQEKLDVFKPDPAAMKAERDARLGSLPHYALFAYDTWIEFVIRQGGLLLWPMEAFATMLIGAALFQWGFIQGRATRPTYLATLLAGYAIGISLRSVGTAEMLRFSPAPQTAWFTWDIARIALTLGHISLIHLLLRTEAGARLLAPFQANGRLPLSTYMTASVIGMWILFPGFGLGLWSKFGPAGLFTLALAVIAAQLLAANLWLRRFETGPFEWLWKSLSYARPQPFRRRPSGAPAGAAAE